MPKLTGKVALITGGSRGIGAAIAKRLAVEGATVAITYAKDAGSASAVVAAIEQEGGKALAIQAEATDPAAVRNAVEETVQTLGGIDVLVNNAGTAIPKTFEETSLEEMNRVIDIKHPGNAGGYTIGAPVYERRRPRYNDRVGRGRARHGPRIGCLFGYEGCGENVCPGPVARGGEPRHYGQQCPTGPHRHRFESGGR